MMLHCTRYSFTYNIFVPVAEATFLHQGWTGPVIHMLYAGYNQLRLYLLAVIMITIMITLILHSLVK